MKKRKHTLEAMFSSVFMLWNAFPRCVENADLSWTSVPLRGSLRYFFKEGFTILGS